jgi:hypothetical protein
MRRVGTVLIMAAVALAVTPAGAFAQDDDEPDVSVVIQGVAQVGQRLDAVLSAGGNADDWLGATYSWYRCGKGGWGSCRVIGAPSAASYTVVDDDLGHRIRVEVRGDDERVRSEPTAMVTPAPIAVPAPLAAPPPPPPPPPPAPAPAADPVPTPLAMMRPAPTVRISGRLTRSGAMITRLSVRAPRGARIAVRCRGRGCPRRSLARPAAVTRLRAFERHLRAGIRLEIRVTRAGFIGKHTLIRIRLGKVPWRRDSCLFPGSNRPARCPGA